MKKTALSLILTLLTLTHTKAQTASGPEAGLNISNYTFKSDGQTMSQSAKTGFRAGGIADYTLYKGLHLQPAILYVMNGYNVTNITPNINVTIHTLEIPMNLVYKFGLPQRDKFFIGLGPYFAINVAATSKQNGTATSLNIGNEPLSDQFTLFDYGIGLTTGYEFTNGLFFSLHYQHGLTNLLPGGDANNSIESNNFGITIGYLSRDKGGKHGKKKPIQTAKAS